jgi:hypothetical protein
VCKGRCLLHIKQGFPEQIRAKSKFCHFLSQILNAKLRRNPLSSCEDETRRHTKRRVHHMQFVLRRQKRKAYVYGNGYVFLVSVQRYTSEVSNQLPPPAETLRQESRYPLDRRQARLHSRSGRGGDKKKTARAGSRTPFYVDPSCNLVTT